MNIEKLLGKPQKIELDQPSVEQVVAEWRKNLAKHMRQEVYTPSGISFVQADEMQRRSAEGQSHLCVAIAHLGHLRMTLDYNSPEHKIAGDVLHSCILSYHHLFPTTSFDVGKAHKFGLTLWKSGREVQSNGD